LSGWPPALYVLLAKRVQLGFQLVSLRKLLVGAYAVFGIIARPHPGVTRGTPAKGSIQCDASVSVRTYSNSTTGIYYLSHHEGRDGEVVAYQRLVRRNVVYSGNGIIAMVLRA
jgi:hypothetical protein